MVFQEMVPWRRGRNNVSIRNAETDPLNALQRRMNRMFDDFFGDFGDPERFADKSFRTERKAVIDSLGLRETG